MSTLKEIEQLSKPYDNIRLESDPTLQKLEQKVLLSEGKVKNPNIIMTQEEFKQAELNILKERKAVSERLVIIHEHHEIEDKSNLTLPLFEANYN